MVDDMGYSFIMLTSGLQNEIELFRNTYNTEFYIYNADDVMLKTMIRSNPGLLLFKDGVIIKKWHHRSLPGKEELESLLINP